MACDITDELIPEWDWNQGLIAQPDERGPIVDYFAEKDPFEGGIQLRVFRGGVHASYDIFAAGAQARYHAPFSTRSESRTRNTATHSAVSIVHRKCHLHSRQPS